VTQTQRLFFLKDEADSLSIPQQLIDKLTEQIEHNLSKQTKKNRQRQIIKKHQRGHKEKGNGTAHFKNCKQLFE
jgi:hypothetical protein